MSTIDDAFKAAAAGFDFTKPIDRLRGAYVRRRAEVLLAQTSTLTASKLATQITAEMTVVKDYLAGKEALIKGTETITPTHYDLKISAVLVTQSVGDGHMGELFFNGLLKESQANRARWVGQIVWRAVALHSDTLWKTAGPPPQLQRDALDELLDRRLHAVETMHFDVNTIGYGNMGRTWKVSGPTGPWEDGYRLRYFEYPWVQPADPFEPLLPMMPEWKKDSSLTGTGVVTEVNFDPPNGVRVRIPGDPGPAWRLDQSRVWINFRPLAALPPAKMIQEMFTPRPDFWRRSWLFCDHVGSLLNIEALWFGLRRRTGSDDTFDAVMKRPNYIRLGPVVGDQHDRDILMADDQDPFFENVAVSFDELQIGDFVRFWNSRLYELLPPYGGAWGSEFSLVMDLDVDGTSGKVPRPLTGGPQVKLAGHGLHTRPYNSMASEAIGHITTRFLKAVLTLPTDPAVQRTVDGSQAFVRWTPYESFDLSPWWAEIPKSTWKDVWGYATLTEVLAGVPRTVAHDPGGTGYHPPPTLDAAYFPLYEPAVDHTDVDGDSWRAYLRQRKASASFRLKSTALALLTIDGKIAPGLFYHGSNAKIAVVRPRVRV